MKVWIGPDFGDAPDVKGDGGIRRVVEAQKRYLPEYGDEIVSDVFDADVVAVHAMMLEKPLKREQLLVHHNHGLYWSEYEWEQWSYGANEQVIESMRRADVVTAVSEWTAHAIRRGSMINPTVIGHGIDVEDYHDDVVVPEPECGGYALWNKTRIDPICDPDPVAVLAKMAEDVQFVSTLMHNDVSPLSNLVVTGVLPYDNARDFTRRAGVYLATTRETFGIGTLEAMIFGVPVLGWDWGGQAEFVEQGVTGWLSRPGDYDNLLEGLRYCLANRDKMGQAARQYVVREHDWRKVIGRYHDLYARYVGIPGRLSPRVSVVVPCYNLERYLGECLESVLAQRMQDWEVIIVDDASPHVDQPSISEVVATVCGDDPRVRVLVNDTNQYLAGALNRGIAESRAGYVMPLDADNMLGQTDSLGLLCDVLDGHRELDIVYAAMSWFEEDADGTQRERGVSPWPPREFSYRSLMRGGNQIPSTSLYRKKVWERVGGYRRRCRTQEDADFWVRAVTYGARPAKVGDFTYFRYRDRLSSMSHTEPTWPYYAWTKKSWFSVVDQADRYDAASSVSACEPTVISVVIPVGPGHEQYLLDAIDSVVAQTYTRWEIIVVNDTGRPDSELGWLPSFVSVVRTTKRGKCGPAKARNVGIKAAQAPLFVLLDADDYLAAPFLERTLEVFKRTGGYVYTDWIKAESGEVEKVEDFSLDRIKLGQYCAVTCLYEKEAWSAVGGFSEKISTWEDWDFFLKLCKAGYCGTHIPQALFYYRLSTGTVRERLYSDVDANVKEIHRIHADIFTEGKEMGCGCGGGSYIPPYVEAPASIQALEAMSGQDTVLLRFNRNDGTTVTYLGPATNAQYRFGDDEGHRVQWVHKGDAEKFLMLEDFELIQDGDVMTETGPRLIAVGPPASAVAA